MRCSSVLSIKLLSLPVFLQKTYMSQQVMRKSNYKALDTLQNPYLLPTPLVNSSTTSNSLIEIFASEDVPLILPHYSLLERMHSFS